MRRWLGRPDREGATGWLSPRSWSLPLGLALLLLTLVALAAGCALYEQRRLEPTRPVASRYAIAPEFSAFYQQHGALRVFGYPLANPYRAGADLHLVQYFQRMRLELDAQTDSVTITPLGEWAVPDREEWDVLEPPPGGQERTFAGSDYSVRDEFLVFYERYGGEEIFGLPLTPQLDEGGVRVQYFTNARLEWHPDASREQRVQVAMLGEAHYGQVGLYQNTGRPLVLPAADIAAAALQASVDAPILFQDQQQVVHINVFTDDDQTPLAGVPVEVTATFERQTVTQMLPPTDGYGHAQTELAIPADARRGQRVQLVFTAQNAAGETIGQASYSFKLWW